MGKRLSEWLIRVSTGWVTLAAVIIFLLFTALVLPAQSASSDQAAHDAGTPDLSFTYSSRDLYKMAEAYGPEGRAEYIRVRFTFDLVWPLVYLLFLVTTMSWVYGRAFPTGSPWRLANLAPVLGALFDYLENIATSWIMGRYPAQTPVVDVLATVFTPMKWILVGSSFLLLLFGIAAGICRWFGNRGRDG